MFMRSRLRTEPRGNWCHTVPHKQLKTCSRLVKINNYALCGHLIHLKTDNIFGIFNKSTTTLNLRTIVLQRKGVKNWHVSPTKYPPSFCYACAIVINGTKTKQVLCGFATNKPTKCRSSVVGKNNLTIGLKQILAFYVRNIVWWP